MFPSCKYFKAGGIRTSNYRLEENEMPAVWLTKSPRWDYSYKVGRINNLGELKDEQSFRPAKIFSVNISDEYMKNEIGMCRVLISEKLPTNSWATYKYVSGISKETYTGLNRFSRKNGGFANQWFCSFSPIPIKYWEGFEIFVVDQWVRWDERLAIKEFIDLCWSCNHYNQPISQTIRA